MSSRSQAATLVVLAALTAACVGPLAGEPGRSDHDAAVERLEDAAGTADGWVVVDVPIRHEGGGRATWWLAPCEGHERPATVTGYSGSDVADVPGTWFVDEDRTVPCREPAREVTVDGRAFAFGTPMVDLGSRWVPLDGTDRIEVTDQATGAQYDLDPNTGVVIVDPCDGLSSWSVSWFESVAFTRRSCLDTLGALPDVVLQLVPEAGRDLTASAVTVTPEQAEALRDRFAMLDGWSALQVEGGGSDGDGTWQGPCRTLPAGERARAIADLQATATLVVQEQPCG